MRHAKFTPNPEIKYTITDGFPFFLYDPEGDGFTFFKTQEERDKRAAAVIKQYQGEYSGEGWSQEVEGVFAGTITARATKTNIEYPPPDNELDEERCDNDGKYWPEEAKDYCDYKLMPFA